MPCFYLCMDNSLSKIKQPPPSVSSGIVEKTDSNGKKYKVITAPDTGVVTPAKISQTPIRDWVDMKGKMFSDELNKQKKVRRQPFDFQKLATLTVLFSGAVSFIKLLKNKKPH